MFVMPEHGAGGSLLPKRLGLLLALRIVDHGACGWMRVNRVFVDTCIAMLS